jgi:hypothetical protein
VIRLDLADLVVIAGRTLGTGTAAAFEGLDVPAAEAALADAALAEAALAETACVEAAHVAADGGSRAETVDVDAGVAAGPADPLEVAAAGIALVRALVVHRPFPRDGLRLATVSGLQFLAVNGWRAELEPPETAAVVMEALASGRLSPHAATAWLAPRLSLLPEPVLGSVVDSAVGPVFEPYAASGSAASGPVTSGSVVARRLRAALNPPPRSPRPPRSARIRPGRRLISALIALGLGGLGLLATACAGSTSNDAPGPAYHVTAPRSPSAECPAVQCW